MAYDSDKIAFTVKTDKVDLVAAENINTVQTEIRRLEDILGTNIKGIASDLAVRLNRMMDNDGSLFSGSSFPSPSFTSQLFYRTDLGLPYVRNSSGTFVLVGSSLTNIALEWHGSEAGAAAMQLNTAQGIAADNYVYYSTDATSLTTCLRTKFFKISGMTTANIYLRMRLANSGETATVRVDIGGQNTDITHTGDQVITAKTGTITISGLTNDTAYDMIVQLKVTGTSFCELYDIVIVMT